MRGLGVQCNATTGRVIKLSLNDTRQFSQYYSLDRLPTLNLSLFHPFEELKSLNLSYNLFEGWHENKAYDGFGCLKQLKILDLSHNYFNDTLLPYLNNLTSLTSLNLGWNNMGEGLKSAKQEGVQCNATTGRVIKLSLNDTRQFSQYYSLDRLPTLNLSLFHPFEELKCLKLSYNYFEGWHEDKAYDGFKCLKQLKILDLSANFFNATLLPYLNNLTSLTTLNLGGNNMGEGLKSAKQGLANLTNLKVLNLAENLINNSLSNLGLKMLRNLEELDLSYNGMSGSLTLLGLTNLTNLKSLDLSDNQINTSLASLGLQNLKNLEELNMAYNGMSGSLTSLGLDNLTALETLELSYNFISWLGLANLKGLKALDLSYNEMNGSPSSSGICELMDLVELNLENNNLGGQVPQCLTNFTYLKFMGKPFKASDTCTLIKKQLVSSGK
ncbi:hypothetical protein Pint_10213 [Pistacia integerrima]|uniref:Uncharacterized protein n=1 Tax=Pistacia integerrima TaxID=434235 RepID=A0ACC0XJG1_9ROSI|nr:hypothetical protein Pint_10213 [Pistacia integerrima]